MQIDVAYADPLQVSQSEEPDFAIVTMSGFGRFKDKRGIPMPDSIIKKVFLPAQFTSKE